MDTNQDNFVDKEEFVSAIMDNNQEYGQNLAGMFAKMFEAMGTGHQRGIWSLLNVKWTVNIQNISWLELLSWTHHSASLVSPQEASLHLSMLPTSPRIGNHVFPCSPTRTMKNDQSLHTIRPPHADFLSFHLSYTTWIFKHSGPLNNRKEFCVYWKLCKKCLRLC